MVNDKAVILEFSFSLFILLKVSTMNIYNYCSKEKFPLSLSLLQKKKKKNSK